MIKRRGFFLIKEFVIYVIHKLKFIHAIVTSKRIEAAFLPSFYLVQFRSCFLLFLTLSSFKPKSQSEHFNIFPKVHVTPTPSSRVV